MDCRSLRVDVRSKFELRFEACDVIKMFTWGLEAGLSIRTHSVTGAIDVDNAALQAYAVSIQTPQAQPGIAIV